MSDKKKNILRDIVTMSSGAVALIAFCYFTESQQVTAKGSEGFVKQTTDSTTVCPRDTVLYRPYPGRIR